MSELAIELMIKNIKAEFTNRVIFSYLRFNPEQTGGIEVDVNEKSININLTFNNEISTIYIPIPYILNGVEFLNKNDVVRPTCKYLHKELNKEFSYLEIINEIFLGSVDLFLPEIYCKSKANTMQLIKYGYENNSLAYTVYTIQKQINYFVNLLPLHNTFMNSWVMNKRITIIDPNFDEIHDPEKQYEYQVEKNRLYFDKGWTSLGLSDGSLASHNYILSYDVRNLTPFGQKFHNPQRNLYSTFGMKGSEQPLLQTQSMKNLADAGISRTGWNLLTVFVDIPDVWEDQIMVDISHADKFTEATKKYICYGKTKAVKGDKPWYNSILYTDPEDKKVRFDIVCDEATVTDIKDSKSVVGGVVYDVKEIVVTYKRFLKDGAKITNLAANKGIIRLKKLGYAIHPITGEKQKIDVIVSSKAVLKRKNYTQILEALLNTVNDNSPIIIDDYAETSEAEIKSTMKSKGYNEEGVWKCSTYAGEYKCVCGKVFWGTTHDADDTTWTKERLNKTNTRGHRSSGLKFSTIEFRALNTRFGNNNAIEKEILSYASGAKDIREWINVLRSKLGKFIYNSGTIDIYDIKPAITNGVLYSKEQLKDTIADSNKHLEGFYLKLPVKYQLVLSEAGEVLSDGFPSSVGETINGIPVKEKIVIDKIYVPYYNLRKSWNHSVGKYGLSDTSNLLNILITMCHRYKDDPESGVGLSLIYKAIYNYFNCVKERVNSKKGDINKLGMSVRYPYSVKAVATLSNSIPKNTVQIHKDMANSLNVKEGDVVLVERFPCLGFMSIRPQKITITSDKSCKFTIRASGNSLGSLTLDFDGDVIYLASFHSPAAKKLLVSEWNNPNKYCIDYINKFNAKMGHPRTKEMSLSDYDIKIFEPLTVDSHAEIIGKLTGVKSFTGPIVALAYNLLRIMENSPIEHTDKVKAGIEVFIDTVANSVFKQKHGKESLHKIVMDAVCTADEQVLVDNGFEPEIVQVVCSTIRKRAVERKITDLLRYHAYIQKMGGSNIINRIVREENKLYFASRSSVDLTVALDSIDKFKVVDIPSSIFYKIMSCKYSNTKTQLDKFKEARMLKALHYYNTMEYSMVKELFQCVDKMFTT